MKLFGADDIGFEPLGPAAKRRKDPARVASGKKGGRPKGIRNHSRKPMLEAARGFLSTVGLNKDFKLADFRDHMRKEGWPESACYKSLNDWKTAKVVKHTGTGLYKRVAELKLVKSDKAA
jgi:hypothetical protein